MKERPILFNSEMVRAILDGRKTMTRRAVKPQPEQDTDCPYHIGTGIERVARTCPYGKPGDRLWVRETWRGKDWGYSRPKEIIYRASNDFYGNHRETTTHPDVKWTPSIYMPRWASRITLEITNVRVERLQKINNADALAEGTPGAWVENSEYPGGYEENENKVHVFFFRQLWDSINAKRGYSWDANPWVWVIEFERVLNG